MAIFYSESTKGFYDTDFADYHLPDDVIEITPEERDEMITESMTTIINE